MPLAAVVAAPDADYAIEQREAPAPGPDEVRIRVHACGFCHSDENIRRGWLGNAFPRVPGHEAAGTIEAVGDRVPQEFSEGDRVGVGWHGGHCNACPPCRAGDFKRCRDAKGCGTSYDGGFATHLLAPWTGLVRIPDAVSFKDAGPVMCAGITVWNGLRATGASWGDLVAVQGIGGLGHLAVQYADAMGFETVAVSRGDEKAGLARDLGADHYVDAAAEDPGKAILRLGGARGIVSTVPSGQAMQPLVKGLGPDGRMAIVGVSSEEITLPAAQFLGNDKGVIGSVIGTPYETEELLRFGALKGVRPWIETFPLQDIAAAQRKLLGNDLRFRAVLTMD